MSIAILLYILAALCFLLATIPVPSRINLVALGLFLWVLTFVISGTVH